MSAILYKKDDHQCIKFDDLTLEGEVQSNQFLIVHKKRGVLVDCGGYQIYKNVLGAISKYLPAGSLDAIFLSHQDPDIGSGLNLWLPITKANIMISALWVRFIPAFCVRGLAEERIIGIPDQGMRFDLAGSPLVAVPGHFLHSCGNFQLYDPVAKILFTGDLGASLQPHMENIATEEDFEKHVPVMAGFHNRFMPSSRACKYWTAMVRQLDVEMIVPQHGARITGKNLVEKFYDWVEQEKTAVDNFADNLFQLP